MVTDSTVGRLYRAICKTVGHSAPRAFCGITPAPPQPRLFRVRYTPAHPDAAIHQRLDPRRIVRWLWLGRIALGCAILVSAVLVWERAAPVDTLIATLAFAVALLSAVGSAMYAEVYRRPVRLGFYVLQCTIDLLLVTALVHMTGGWSSQFAALYILVIAFAALLLPFRGGVLIAMLACVLYAADVLTFRPGSLHLGTWVQLSVFALVALGSGLIAARLRQAGDGREALAAQLAAVQLEAADILRIIQSGIITVDASGRLLYANPAASDLLGVHLRALVGRPVLTTLMGVAPELATLLERSAREGIRRTRAEGVIHRDGELLQVGLTTTVAERPASSGGPTATAIFQDISDSKRLQAMHVRAERLQAVAELSASLAHEIRNPLASIRSASEQLARRHAARPGADEDEQSLFALTLRESDRLSRLLSEFLDFARTGVTRLAPVDLGDAAHTAVSLVLQHPDRRPGITITVEQGTDAHSAVIDGDADLLHRAVFNLVLNAVQAVGDTGQVVVRVLRTTDAAVDGDAWAVQVDDNGPGVPAALRDRLFEPFVTGKSGGTGLGLPVVHRAAEAHRGVVLFDALPIGTRFTLVLPSQSTAAAATASDLLMDVGMPDGVLMNHAPSSASREAA